MTIFNSTPHEIIFREENGAEFSVPSHGVINATPTEEVVGRIGETDFVKTVFKPNAEGWAIIEAVEKSDIADSEGHTGTIIVGSMIAAQAYPGKVFAMTPAAGYERVPVEQKRMNPRKFTTFG